MPQRRCRCGIKVILGPSLANTPFDTNRSDQRKFGVCLLARKSTALLEARSESLPGHPRPPDAPRHRAARLHLWTIA